MTTGYSVRTRTLFTLGQLLPEAQRALSEITSGRISAEIVAVPTLRSFMTDRDNAPRASAKLLARGIGDPSPLLDDGVLMTADADAATGIGEIDVGFPEDPEAGRWFEIDVGVDRSAAGRLLAIAVATAAARLTGSPVLDEYKQLVGERFAEPEAIIERLQGATTVASGRLSDIAPAILAGVRIVLPTFRSPSDAAGRRHQLRGGACRRHADSPGVQELRF